MKNLTLVGLFSILSLLVMVLTFTTTIYGQEGNSTVSEEPKFFFIQHANSGGISEINSTVYSLELNNVSDKTIMFSDRPERIVKSMSTLDFIGNWSVGEDSYAIDSPNAVLVVDESEKQDTAILKLFKPVYDMDKKTLKYATTPDNATSIELLKEFGQGTIVIDQKVCSNKCLGL